MDGMPWFTEERIHRASAPQTLLPGARSIIAVALSYLPQQEEGMSEGQPTGTVARYARWPDYHQVMKRKLRALASALSQQIERPVRSRVFVDDGPLLERAVAQRAGLGWFGKTLARLERWLDERGHACLGDLRGLALSHLRETMLHAPMTFAFDAEACNQCGRCVTVCAYEARALSPDGQMSLDEAACRSCGLCASVCPIGALH